MTVRIEPTSGRIRFNLREAWRYRELAYVLVWRDLKVRYRQTLFGGAWAILQPLLFMLVFSVSIGRISGIGAEGVPYPLFALAGLVPWTLFSQALSASANSLVGSQNLITKVYFPRLLLPVSAAASFFVDFVVAAAVLFAAILLAGFQTWSGFLLVPLFGLATVVIALAAGIWLAAINVRYRDVRYAIPFLIQLWLFASPVAYTTGLVPTQLQPFFLVNPMAGLIEGFRWATLGGTRPDGPILLSAASTSLMLIAGLAYFRRVEQTFADTI